MQEYNWKKEREKYRPDFMKTPEQAEQPAQPSPSAPQAAPRPAPAAKQKKSYAGWIVAVVFLLIAAVLCVLFARNRESTSMLAHAAEKYQKAVGVIVLTADLQNGKKVQLPVATAWAFAPDKFATNAHVVTGLQNHCDELKGSLAHTLLERISDKSGFHYDVDAYLGQLGENRGKEMVSQCLKDADDMIRGFSVSIMINGSSHESLPVTHVQIHPEYGIAPERFNPDIAVLTINGKNKVFFNPADDRTLHGLKSGEPVAFLGFPMENLKDDNINLDNPVASMQSGIVVAVSGFDLKDAGPEENYLIRHNLPVTGGASGSPLFNRDGDVVALLLGGNTIGQIQNDRIDRTPSAAMINYAVRSDLMRKMNAPVSIKDYLPR